MIFGKCAPDSARLRSPELYDPGDQGVRNLLVDGKPQVAFLTGVRRDGLLERCVSLHGRVQPDVVLERREINDDTTELERGACRS